MGGQGGDGVMYRYAIPWNAARQCVPGPDLIEARQVGIERAQYVFDNNLQNYGDQKSQSEQMANHIRAARTERSLEHYTGLPWRPAVGVLGGPDVGDNIQVRSKPYPPGGDLMFRPGLDKFGRQLDKDGDAFVLVWDCGSAEFLLIGWLWGNELRGRPAKLHAGGYKYVTPPYRPMPTLIERISHHRVVPDQTAPSSTIAAATSAARNM